MNRTAIRSFCLLFVMVMILGSFPWASLSVGVTEPERIMVDAEQPEAEMIAGYGHNGKYLQPIGAPDPNAIKIYTAEDLVNVRNNLSGSYVLMNDIDLTGFNSGNWVPIGITYRSDKFSGIFDGQGYVIKNMNISKVTSISTVQYAGLFGDIDGATIKNIGLEETEININSSGGSGGIFTGGISCNSISSTIENCYTTGSVYVSSSHNVYVGGICGRSLGNTTSYCYSTGKVTVSAMNPGSYNDSTSRVGGIGGGMTGGIIANCYNMGEVSFSASHKRCDSCVGGICGTLSNASSIAYCYNTGIISSKSYLDSYNSAGGIIGEMSGISISNCYNSGTISADKAGGICGYTAGSIISNCYDAGCILASSYTTPYAGGISGYNSYANIYDCFVLSTQINAENAYIIGYAGTKTNNLALNNIPGNAINDSNGRITAAAAKTQSTYTNLNWDFDTVWQMVSGKDYPQLRCFISNDAKLKTLSVNQGILSPVFDSDQTSYSVSVAGIITSITILATANNSSASVIGTGSKTLNVGDNSFDVVVTAQDGTKKTYTINVTRSVPDAKLKNLIISPGVIKETFDPDKLNYTATVPYETSSINISAEARDSGAKIVSGTGLKTLPEGIATFFFPVTVMAADNTTETYEITITRLSNDTKLKSLIISTDDGIVRIDPSFYPDDINYTASVPYEVKYVTISAAANHPKAEFVGTGLKSLEVGDNTFAIEVTAEDGTAKTYTVTINRAVPSSNADLSSLSINVGTLNPDFQANITSYNASVPYEIEEIAIMAEANYPAAIISGDGQQDLEVGDNLFDITVTAQDRTTKTYTILVTREPQPQLINLILSAGELAPDFDPDIPSYTVSVPGSVSNITITALVGDSNINIGFSEGGAYQVGNQWISDPFDLDASEKVITVYVQKEGLPQASYSITVKRDPPPASGPIYIWEATGDIGTAGRVIFEIPGDLDFLDKYALVCDEDLDVEIYYSPKRTENAIAAGQNTYVFAVRLPNGETREDISFSFKPIGGVVEKNKIIIYGDVNDDGVVTTTDATLVTRWAGGNTATVLRNILAADISDDAFISTTDATLITRRAGGAAIVFPIENKF